jgi:hypothetical protein
MFRAELRWLANGLTLKMDGKLVGEWAEQAQRLITTEVVPKGLIVDLTEVCYVDSAGERLLTWLGRVGAVFVAGSVYAKAVCDRLGLAEKQRTPVRRCESKDENSSFMHSMQFDAGPGRHPKEEK